MWEAQIGLRERHFSAALVARMSERRTAWLARIEAEQRGSGNGK